MDDYEFQKMNQSAARFRSTLGGNPTGPGDDMYNDRIDNVRIKDDFIVQNGTDEAGNPVMANPLNMITGAPNIPKTETQSAIQNVADFMENSNITFNDVGNWIFNSSNPVAGTINEFGAGAVNYLNRFATATPEQQKEMALPTQGKAWLKNEISKMTTATEIQHMKLYEDFFYGPKSAQHDAEAYRIEKDTGIKSDLFTNDPDLYKNMALLAERMNRMKRMPKYRTKDGKVDMQRIINDIPGLAEVLKNQGTSAGSLVLHNIEGMQTIGNLYKDDAFGQFKAGLGVGGSKLWATIRRTKLWASPFYEGRRLNEREQKELEEIENSIKNLPKYSYDTVFGTAGAFLGGAAENANYMLASWVPRGIAAGATIATKGKGAKTIDRIATGVSLATMAGMIAPLQYEELVSKTDDNGNYTYTPEQAKGIAIAQAIPQAVLEDYGMMQIGNFIFGKNAPKSIFNIIKRSESLDAMKAGVKDYLKYTVSTKLRAGLGSYGAELAEEFEQGVSDRVVENIAQILINGKEADVQSINTILMEATGDAAEAMNAVAGFGLAGILLSPVANTRAIWNFRNQVRMATTNRMVQGIEQNAHYNSVLTGVWENRGQIKELHDKAPEVEATILDAHNKQAGIEYGFVNVKELRKTENGEKLVQEIADRNNVSQDELSACLDGSGMLRVKTSTLMQMSLNETQQNDVKNNVTSELGVFTPAQQKTFFEVLGEQMKGIKDNADKTYKEAVDSIIKARFPDAEQAKLAREIIETNYDNPWGEFRHRLNAINTELWDEAEPFVPQLREALKQNGIKLNKGETFREMVVKIANGQADERFNVPALANTLNEIRTGLAPSTERISQLMDARGKLLAVQDRFRQLKPGEIVATATLSAEGLKVYDTLIGMMEMSENEKLRGATARANALMMARMADKMAQAYRAARGVENYTAEDYMREFFRLDVNAQYNEMPQAAQMFQVSPAEFERQKSEVRSRYENTDQWLKAPNGNDTNLTEDQWVTVRTDAFKNWFGDWEGNPAEASKMVDENGEPRPFYHGTQRMDRVGDTFLPERATSGPMAFFTSSKEIATNYSQDKVDTSLLREGSEYKDQFTVVLPNGKKVNIVEYWNYLPAREKNAIRKAAGHVTFDDEADGIIYDKNVTYGVGDLEYKIKANNGNVLQALVDEWLTDGNIWGSEEKFLEVLKLAKVKADVEYLDPKKIVSGVYDVYLNIRNPFNTNNIDEQFIKDLEEASKTAKEYEGNVSDMWDKGRQTPAQFVERVKSDYEAGTTHAWTSIPDWVTDLLKSKGHDGILDKGGKNGGQIHDVAIPFASNQIKDATGRNVGFDPQSGNIYLQEAYHGTGARFDRFDTDYVNTGEGMQYYGWGLYFSKNREVAEEYRRRFTPAEVVVSFTGKVAKSKQKIADELAREIQSEVIGGATVEKAVQNRLDFHKQNLKFYEEHPRQATKKKVKDTQNKIDFLNSNKDGFKAEKQGQVFKADIPEDDVLLDRDKSFEEQPDAVKKALQNIWKELSISKPLNELSGQDIYNYLSRELNGDKNASLKLNDNGVKGIKYTGSRDGQSFVIFDDNAINILEKYYQQGRTAKGAISLTEQGQKIVSLFESADQSTFVHEMAHMFLLDLQEIAGVDRESQQAKDLKTIMAWAEYKPGQADEYKGTASAEEFRKREQAIKEAEAKGDTAEAQRLKDVWVQERFARAFEEYLRTGEAPARGLQRAFRNFKKWLTEIYNDVTGAGVRATPEVEAIMARIVASEEEIEALEASNSIARKLMDANIMPEVATEMLKQWQTEAKEEAKEKLLKELMKAFEKSNLLGINQQLDELRKNTRKELRQVPCFVCEQMLKNGADLQTALTVNGFTSEQEYKDALKEAGGSLNNAVNTVVKAEREKLLTQMPNRQELYNMAENALNSGDYNARLSELEADILRELQNEYNSIPARLRRAFEEIDKNFDEDVSKLTWDNFKKSVYRLKYAEKWAAQEYILIKEFEDAVNAVDEPNKQALENLRKKYEELKEQTIRNKQWINDIGGATRGKMQAIKTAAEMRLARETVAVATNPRYWHRQALAAAKRAWDGLKKVDKGERVDYENAIMAKQEQALFDAMTAQAIKNQKQVDRWLNGKNGFYARAKRMADPKTKADPTMRYYYNHLMYVFGLRNTDGIPPTEQKSITELLSDLRASHQFEDEVPAWIIAAVEKTEPDKDYQQLTMGQLQELKKFTDILYTLARNQNELLTLDVSMDDVVAECTVDYLNNTDYKAGHQKIGEVRGAIGDYMNGLLKPEVILSLLGGKQGGFVKYIYRILFNAAEAEEKAREKEAKVQRELYSKYYTKEELRAMVNDSVMIEGPDGNKVKLAIGEDTDITKENLICMALNWGNDTNRARLCVGLFGVENEQQLAMAEAELLKILQDNLTENDWKFVRAMWNHIGSFADPVSGVLEKSLGVPLDRVKADPFTVTFPDGRTMKMEGGYYPIVKDSGKSTKQSEFDQLEEAKAVGGVSVFGTGMSATKERAKNMFVNQGPLKLTLDVAHNHITAQIHLIHARMAVRDAYKVINNKQIQDMVRRTCGEGTVKSLNEWVLNCWAPPIRPRNWLESVISGVRSKTVGAIMAYRASTALLNAANVVYMAQEIGAKNALIAMVEFWKHPVRNRQMILDVSVFMRNRANNMDRDLQAQNEQILKRHNKVGNAIDKATGGRSEDMRYLMDKYANWLIEMTDMAVSLPLYKWQFEQTYSEEIDKGVPEEQARETANYEATRRVTKVFGSSRAVDTSAVQRSKNEAVKMLTPFFTFANTMMNAVWSKYYEGRFNGSERVQEVDNNGRPVLDENGQPKYTTVKKNFRKRYARFARAILYNFVLGALVETWLRQLPDWLAKGGDDDDDDTIGIGPLSVNKKAWLKNSIGNAAAGFPIINIMTEDLVGALEGRRTGGRGVGVISGSIGRWTTLAYDIAKVTQGKIDAVDFMRDVVRVANTQTGMSDTVTDAMFNTVRFIGDDYQLDNMADLREYIAKTIFDRKLKKK